MELHQRLLLSGALLLAALRVAAPGAAAAATPQAESPRLAQLTQLAGRGAAVSAAVWDLDTDRPLVELAAAQRLTPASLSKILVAAAALETWPPDHSFATELRAASAPADGIIAGDLVLRGGGDATLDETTLWALAAQLRSAGVSQVRGRVLVERAPFGELDCDTVDRCAGLRRSSRAYNAAPSAIGVNYGSWCVMVRAAAASARAQAGGCASGPLPIPLTGSVLVAASGPALRVERDTDERGDRISVSGSIAPGGEAMVHRAMSDPAAGAGLLLRSILLQTGVAVNGGVETTLRATGQDARLLAKVDSIPLQEQVGRMMRWSNNYIADVLTMGVALRIRGSAPASLAEASRELGAFALRAGADGAGGGPRLASGSGLTPDNQLSAQDLIRVLRHAYRDARRFPAFYGSFVVPRDASFDYLNRGNADWLDRVALKTGSLTQPVSVNGIAGYLRKKSGGFAAFAIIINGSERLRQIPAATALAAARADLESILARL